MRFRSFFAAISVLITSQALATELEILCVDEGLRSAASGGPTPAMERVERFQARFKELRAKACARPARWALCSDPRVTSREKVSLLKAAAQLDDAELFLKAGRRPGFDRLLKYVEKKLIFCDPPLATGCASDQWALVFDDYLGRTPFRRWDEDRIAERVAGLKDFIRANRDSGDPSASNEQYARIIEDEGLSGRAVCIINEQSCKQQLNNVNKDLSDALGNYRRQIFTKYLSDVTSQSHYSEPNYVYTDFKTDRILTELTGAYDLSTRRYGSIVNRAAEKTDLALDAKVSSSFPEILYLSDQADVSQWFNTATFTLPGFPLKLRETLAALKARNLRAGIKMSDIDAIRAFVRAAADFNRFADDMAGRAPLVASGILETNGNFSYSTASLLRKLPRASDSERVNQLIAKMREKYGGSVAPLSAEDAQTLLAMWKAQDKLSIPLIAGDQMKPAPQGMAILGADGVGGGAYDAWCKGNALRDHQGDLSNAAGVFNALEEGDANATRIIRSAPDALGLAFEGLSAETRRKLGHAGTYVSGDDSSIWLDKVRTLPVSARDSILVELARRVSEQKREVRMDRAGRREWLMTGPELLRVFGGSDKAAAEAAEKFMKGCEDRLSRADVLGVDWRRNYPGVAMIAWKNEDGSFSLAVAGKSLDERFKAALRVAGRGERVAFRF